MKIRRGIIILLALLLVGIVAYGSLGIKTPALEMNPANLTIHVAPDQSASMENPNFIKEEYVSVLPKGSNIAVDGKVEASSFTGSFTPRKTIDGNTNGVSYWEGKADSYPNVLTIDLKKLASIHAIAVRLNPLNIWGKRTQTFAVKVSSDGELYTELIKMEQYTFDPDRGNEVILEFDTIEAQYVQLEVIDNSGANGAQVAELEVYSK